MRSLVIALVAVLALLASPAAAEVQVNDKTDIVMTALVSCAAGGAGEVVLLEGPLHTLMTATVNGNNVSGKYHFQPQGMNGTGQTTGEKYQAVGVTQSTFKGSLQNGQYTTTFVNNFRIIGQGPGNNFMVHETLHITINANGTATVSHDNIRIDCK